ncbi:serine O-acetyltransferase [Leptospira perolatii]|uniref:Serine acetyltransferase n=1 Tax=Leptospira perolatii TaxID=2023191 RepID=A0A2M9ZSU0_9LEPT|nr:serine O-acetyltransferase [Leptospira perolatii]PJZ71545.1 serine O-acetyltransferase [Leptospira perolatii]PJZ75162.1 serine O-acetyltransferase [Leptospira perolatii]
MFENIRMIRRNDPAAKSYIEIILCYPGLHALWFHLIAHFLYQIKIPLLPRLINTFARFITGVDIHPGAKIAPGIFIDHGHGVVIGETAEIAKGCLIYQGVTLGGTGKESGKRHPTLKENVVVGAGAKILGNIVIEHNVRVGAGSVVMRNVPPDCTVVGIPGKVVRTKIGFGDQGEHMLDHNELPDPVARVFSILVEKIDTLQQEVNEICARQNLTVHGVPHKKDDDELNEFIHGGGI